MTSDRRTGLVIEFDEHVGLGVVLDGVERFPFHCTQISDGSRTIETQVVVSFTVVPSHGGRYEASAITRLQEQR